MTLFCTLHDETGTTMSAQQFLELATKNGALLTPEETQKCQRDTTDWLSRHQVYVGMFGDWHIIDTHSFGYKIYNFIANCVKFCFGLFLLLFLLLIVSLL